jgi:hypothetical protein
MDDEDAKWLAGVFDAHGHIGINKTDPSHDTPNRAYHVAKKEHKLSTAAS